MRSILLILVLIVGLFASDNEEIGTPYIERDKGMIDSAVLAPDGNSFYTLKGNLVTQWQLSPIKKLLSFETNITFQGNGSLTYQINISHDNKRLILYYCDEIQLWDIKSRKHLKTVKEDLKFGTNSKYGFLVLTPNDELHIWSDKDLTLLKTTTIKHDYKYRGAKHSLNMISGDNVLFINYPDVGLFFDLDTFKIIDTMSNERTDDYKARRNSRRITQYRQTYMDKYASKFTPFLWNRYMKFFYYRSSFSTHSSYSSLTHKNKENINEIAFYKIPGLHYSFAKKLYNQKKRVYKFYQFKDAWVVITGRYKFFTGSKNSRKYLTMRVKDWKIVPMNDATFNKYNKNINLKD